MSQMTMMQVDVILAGYKKMVARRDYIRGELRGMKKILGSLTHSDQISTESIHAQEYENADMPRGGQLSDPTARLGIYFAEGKTPKYVRELKSDVRRLEKQLRALERNVNYVDYWMGALSERERLVVEKRILEAEAWHETVRAFQQVFGYGYSKATLKRLKERAMNKIYEAAGCL